MTNRPGEINYITLQGESHSVSTECARQPEKLADFLKTEEIGHSVVEVSIAGKTICNGLAAFKSDDETVCGIDSGCTTIIEASRLGRVLATRYRGGGTIPMREECLRCVSSILLFNTEAVTA